MRSRRESASPLSLGRLPRFADWAQARRSDPAMLSEWQVYRLFAGGRGGWTSFLAALGARLERSGVEERPSARRRQR